MANDDRNRDRTGRYADVRDVAERDMRMARLAAQRKSQREIARLEGCSERTVARGIQRALKAWRAQGGKELADRILNDLEAVYAGLWEIVEDPGHKVSPAGRLVEDSDGNPVVNLDLRADAYDKLRKVLADMRALLGTDAPRRSVQARVEVDLDAQLAANDELLQARVAAMTEDMAALAKENASLRRQLEPGDVVDAEVLGEAG
jgi:DNA-binding CsgD family transcriptional regulator